eukprot:m.121009 g.121009  ORF g.121009 m.121009 type:complete len:666 (-) comp21872_c0_seq1:287-2284(-)
MHCPRTMQLLWRTCLVVGLTRGVNSDPTQCEKGPCGPGNDRCVGVNPQQYVFHLSDETCAINDPNGPFYDPVHGMYHNFYQDHLAEPQATLGPGKGPDWGHWVSRDFVHWARLPVAIWNDKWYDAVAIFSGSTTIVDGKPVIVYPGLCSGVDCPTHFTYDVAIPADPSDPFYTNWTKPSYNPIVNGTGDDPSTAWQTPSGEWRLIGNQGCSAGDEGATTSGGGAPIYGSLDFKTWYKVGCTTLLLGDCPTFFPLPSLTPGSESSVGHDNLPNWVHKAGSGNDQVQVGVWADGKPGSAANGGTPGTWSPQGGSTPLDNGKTHASKDFWDPTTKRRIMWVWGTLPNGIQTIPRDMTYDPRTGKINYAPVDEMKTLRSAEPLDTLSEVPVGPGASVVLKASSASDINITFARPTQPTTFTLDFAGGSLYFDYTLNDTVAVGFSAQPGSATEEAIQAAEDARKSKLALKAALQPTLVVDGDLAVEEPHNLTTYMPGFDMGGNDFPLPCKHYPVDTSPTTCEALCKATKGCGAWVYVIRGLPAGAGDCCLKHAVEQRCPSPNPKCTSGVLVPTTQCGGGGGGGGKFSDVVTMLPTDTHINIRLFLDTAVAEAYFMGGRVAMTIPVAASTTDWNVMIGAATAGALINQATSWGMSGIYVTPEEVLATPRRG